MSYPSVFLVWPVAAVLTLVGCPADEGPVPDDLVESGEDIPVADTPTPDGSLDVATADDDSAGVDADDAAGVVSDVPEPEDIAESGLDIPFIKPPDAFADDDLGEADDIGEPDDAPDPPEITLPDPDFGPEDAGPPPDVGIPPEPENNVQCLGASADTGQGTKFAEFSYSPPAGGIYNFNCTLCPGGYPDVQGTYKRYLGDNLFSDPNVPEVISFTDNDFIRAFKFTVDGQEEEALAYGFFFCPEPSDLVGQEAPDFWNMVMIYTAVDPPGVFGLTPGVADLCFFGENLEVGPSDIGLACSRPWDGNPSMQSQFCLIGATIGDQTCPDTF